MFLEYFIYYSTLFERLAALSAGKRLTTTKESGKSALLLKSF